LGVKSKQNETQPIVSKDANATIDCHGYFTTSNEEQQQTTVSIGSN